MFIGYGFHAGRLSLLECDTAPALRTPLAGPKIFGTSFCAGTIKPPSLAADAKDF
jgi:hypothetical protein